MVDGLKDVRPCHISACGTGTTANAHRDEAPTAIDGDDVFGGWLNLDDYDQSFTCAPGSHTEVGNQNTGFANITDVAELDNYHARRITTSVPPDACSYTNALFMR